MTKTVTDFRRESMETSDWTRTETPILRKYREFVKADDGLITSYENAVKSYNTESSYIVDLQRVDSELSDYQKTLGDYERWKVTSSRSFIGELINERKANRANISKLLGSIEQKMKEKLNENSE